MRKIVFFVFLFSPLFASAATSTYSTASTNDSQEVYFGSDQTSYNYQTEMIAAKFHTTSTVTSIPKSVTVRLKNVNSPSDSAQFRIVSDSGGSPNMDDVISSATKPANEMSGSFTNYTLTIDTGQLAADTDYWLVGSRTGSLHSSNVYSWTGTTGLGSMTGQKYYRNGTGWYAGDNYTYGPFWSIEYQIGSSTPATPSSTVSSTLAEAVNYADFFIDFCALLMMSGMLILKRRS